VAIPFLEDATMSWYMVVVVPHPLGCTH